MCCQETRALDLPAEVIEALAHYRRLLEERGWDWGDEQLPDFFRWARFSLLGPVFDAFAATGDWAKAIRSVIGEDVPPGIVVVGSTEAEGYAPGSDPPGPRSQATPWRSTSWSTRPRTTTSPSRSPAARCAWPREVLPSRRSISMGPIRCSPSCSATRR
jgi:hypothetical protein